MLKYLLATTLLISISAVHAEEVDPNASAGFYAFAYNYCVDKDDTQTKKDIVLIQDIFMQQGATFDTIFLYYDQLANSVEKSKLPPEVKAKNLTDFCATAVMPKVRSAIEMLHRG